VGPFLSIKWGQIRISKSAGFFRGQLFAELEGLEANGGARDVIANHSDDLATVFFPEGAIDVDTPQDYEMLEAIMP
jgi:molybdenum cofactor cytidylyltransferase